MAGSPAVTDDGAIDRAGRGSRLVGGALAGRRRRLPAWCWCCPLPHVLPGLLALLQPVLHGGGARGASFRGVVPAGGLGALTDGAPAACGRRALVCCDAQTIGGASKRPTRR